MDLQATITDLRNRGARPRVHPNGFIQLDITPHQRIHCWPIEALPCPPPRAELHDHVYGFHSVVLRGELHNIEYAIEEAEDGDLRMVQVSPYLVHGKSLPLESTDSRRYRASISNVSIMPTGTEYRFEPRLFHRTLAAGLTVTLMTTDPYDEALKARVMCRADAPDPKFVREMVDPDLLWLILNQLT